MPKFKPCVSLKAVESEKSIEFKARFKFMDTSLRSV